MVIAKGQLSILGEGLVLSIVMNKIREVFQGYSQEFFEEYLILTYLGISYTPQQSFCPSQNYQYCLNSSLSSSLSTFSLKLNACENHCKNDSTLIENNHGDYIQCMNKFYSLTLAAWSYALTLALGTGKIYQIQRMLSYISYSIRSQGQIYQTAHVPYDQLHDALVYTTDPPLD